MAEEAGVGTATLYRWIQRYERDGRTSSLLPYSRRGERIRRHMPPDVESILGETIEAHYLRQERPSVAQTTIEIARRCHLAGLPAPHRSTVERRIAEITEERRVKRRHGRRAAQEHFQPKPGRFPEEELTGPLSVVQIDHTKLDVIVVDDVMRRPIGRPWITLAIDVSTRTTAGFYVSLDPPSAASVGLCLTQAILPKEPWLRARHLDLLWPCHGLPAMVQADNAKEFRGSMLARACAEYGITLEWRLVATPHYGAYIERLLGTILTELHGLPGTTFANVEDRGDYDAEGKAVFTLGELEAYVATFLLGVYHERIHSALGTTPRTAYEQGLAGDGVRPALGAPRLPSDPERLRLDFLPFVERVVQPTGVVVDSVHYYSDALRRFVHARDPRNRRARRKLLFRRDPRDVSVLHFWDPDLKQYFRVPYRNRARPPISLWELREAQRAVKAEGQRAVNEAAIFETYTRLRALEDAAKRETTKVRRARQRRRLHEQARSEQHSESSPALSSPGPQTTLTVPENPPPPPAEIVPFEVEELEPTPYWASRPPPPCRTP
ncbi:MAG: DNA-binding domain-containing protein [Longimicrobiales bacterium]